MFFLIRVTFWVSIVILLLPTGKAQQTAQGPQVGAAEAVTAASAAFSDMRQFCARQPEACEKGSQAAAAFGQKAQASAKMIYEFFTERVGHDDAAPAADKTAETASPAAAKTSQNTLTASDRAPAWRGSPPARPVQHAKRPS